MSDPPTEQSEPMSDEEATSEEGHPGGRFEQFVKRAVYTGLGALFTTEEGIRKLASEVHLPKDVANFLITQAATSKDELLRIVARELRHFLETLNVSGELQKLLTSLSFEIKTEVRFIPNDSASGVKPEVKRKVAVKHKGQDISE